MFHRVAGITAYAILGLAISAGASGADGYDPAIFNPAQSVYDFDILRSNDPNENAPSTINPRFRVRPKPGHPEIMQGELEVTVQRNGTVCIWDSARSYRGEEIRNQFPRHLSALMTGAIAAGHTFYFEGEAPYQALKPREGNVTPELAIKLLTTTGDVYLFTGELQAGNNELNVPYTVEIDLSYGEGELTAYVTAELQNAATCKAEIEAAIRKYEEE